MPREQLQSGFCLREGHGNIESDIIVQDWSQIGGVSFDADSATVRALLRGPLRPSPKLQNLLYPIPGKGSANHLIDVKVDPTHHQDAVHRLLHNFDLDGFGTNAGESIICETLPGRNVFDVFFPGQSLFLLNADGKTMRKKYASMTWKTMEAA